MTNGSKYEATRTLKHTEIAKLVRKDLADATKRGEFPKGTKFSVRARWATHSPAIDVGITEFPGVELRFADTCGLTEEARSFVYRAEQILQAYNRNDSKPGYDHFDVRFYGHADVSAQLIARERNRKLAGAGDQRALLAQMLNDHGADGMASWRAEAKEIEEAIVWIDGKGRQGRMPKILSNAWRTKRARERASRAGLMIAA